MLSVPMIVMDGAALYDARENKYLCVKTLERDQAAALREMLDRMGLSYFIYTVHHGRTCIFHQGPLRSEERAILDRMRASPYRSYLEGEILDEAEIVYFKVIGSDARISQLEKRLGSDALDRKLRLVSRPQSEPGVSGLYFYAGSATMKNAKEALMKRLWEKEPGLRPVEVFSRTPYRTEADALHLLHRVGNAYEPLWIFAGRDKKE
ncbi:MAG: hypothetical protein J5967_00860, partial [Oscillospiraceae bacterium]|nr:hypothetical protein [Oscillospiraceae bacterium]